MTMDAVDLLFWRQAINNYLLVMDLMLAGILCLYINSYFCFEGFRSAWKLARVRAALWILVHIVGLTMQRAWGVVMLRAFAHGQDVMSVEQHLPIYFVGTVFAFVGLAGTIHTFTPLAGQDESSFWKRSIPLILAIVAASVFTLIMKGV